MISKFEIFFHQIPSLDASGERIPKGFEHGIAPNDARELVTKICKKEYMYTHSESDRTIVMPYHANK